MELIVPHHRHCRPASFHGVGLIYTIEMQGWSPDGHGALRAAQVEKAQDCAFSILGGLPCFQQDVGICHLKKACLLAVKDPRRVGVHRHSGGLREGGGG